MRSDQERKMLVSDRRCTLHIRNITDVILGCDSHTNLEVNLFLFLIHEYFIKSMRNKF